MTNRFRVKIGEIELELEGDAEYIQRERSEFLINVLPQAVDAMARTKYIQSQAIDASELAELPEATQQSLLQTVTGVDLSRTSLIEFINEKKSSLQWEIALFAAYFEEKKNGKKNFNSDDVKRYFSDTRKTAPSNPSQIIAELERKGYITSATDAEVINSYFITGTGLGIVENYKPRPEKEKKIAKAKKSRVKTESTYTEICVDDLNLHNYPDIHTFSKFVDKMMLLLYIITNEKKGERFSVNDVEYLLSDMMGESVTIDQIKGVFRAHKRWFKTENDVDNKKTVRKKLLKEGIEYAKALGL